MVSGLTAAELAALQPVTGPASSPVAVPVPVPAGAGPTGASVDDGRPEVDATGGVPNGSAGVVGQLDPAVLRHQRNRLLRGILAFIAGFTLVFTTLGATASSIGRLFDSHQQTLEVISGILIVLFGAMLVAMASGITLPMSLAGERRFLVRPSVLGAWAPPVMGMAFAFAWTPCIGPVLGSVLSLAAGSGGSASGGVALLLAYSLGLGVPFLLSGLAFGRMTDLLARVRGRLRLVDLVGGIVLVGFGLLLLTHNVDLVSAHVSTWLHDLHLDRLATS
jgi:cytochrome c-type biogenesis protein